MSTGHHADTLDTARGIVGGGEESVALFLARRARGGARLVVPVPQRRQPDGGPGGAAAHRPAAGRLPPPAPARPARRPRGGLDPLGRSRSRLQRPAHQHRHHRPARPAAARRRQCGRGASCCRPAGSRRRRARWPTPRTTPTRPTGRPATATRCGAAATGFRADGAYGQFALVLPEHDLVVAVTSCTETTHEVLDAVWDELLPHLADAPLPADPDAHARLTAALDTAAAPASGSTATAPAAPGPWRFDHTPTTEHPALRSVEVRRGEQRLGARGRRRRAG